MIKKVLGVFFGIILCISLYFYSNYNVVLLSSEHDIKLDSSSYVGKDVVLDTLKTGKAAATENTKILQNAINEVSEAGGGTIYLPHGIYYFGRGGYNNSEEMEDFAIKPRNNVHIKGKGTDENSSSYTILKPLYNDPTAKGGMDMFYFNNYKDVKFEKKNFTVNDRRDVSYFNVITKKVEVWKNQTIYLINADFSDFVIDGEEARGGRAIDKLYRTDGKGFMINLFADCDWNNVVVKNVDATGFGVDCPINSTIKNCKAINCGKAADKNDGGASGFGIGVGYSNEESLVIENSIAINNKKFGFFFEHQGRFSDTNYTATKSKGFVVSNSIAGGNLYDFGGITSYDVSYENNKSVSNKGTYYVPGLKNTNTNVGAGYTDLIFNGKNIVLNKVQQPISYFYYSTNSYFINTDVFSMVTDVKNNTEEIKWAVNSGIIQLKEESSTIFEPNKQLNRIEVIRSLYNFVGMNEPVLTKKDSTNIKDYTEKLKDNGIFKDLWDDSTFEYDLNYVWWAYNKGILSKDTTFRPTSDCTRAQFITMLYRMAGSPNVSGSVYFTDVPTTSYYYNAVVWAYNTGITKGTLDKIFDPNGVVTKSQLAIFLYRYKNVVNNQSYKLKINVIGGSDSNPSTYSPTTGYTLKNPTRSGFTFKGWTGSNGTTPSKSVTIKAGTTGTLSYTANWQPNLLSLSVKELTTTKTYNVGDSFDKNSLVLVGKYGDNNIKDVTSYTVEPKTFSKSGVQKVTVSVGSIKTTVDVTVLEEIKGEGEKVESGQGGSNKDEPKISIKNISISKTPNKLEYFVDEYLDTAGMELTVTFSDGTKQIVKSGYEVNVSKITDFGNKIVTVTYQGFSAYFEIVVKDVQITGIAISELPNKTSYIVGEKFDSIGLKILVHKNSGYQEVVTNGMELSINHGYTFNKAGVISIDVKYQGFTTKFNVNVYTLANAGLRIVSRPTKTSYVVGEKLDLSGLKVELVYGENNTKIIEDYSTLIENGTELTTVGSHNITVYYNDKTTSFDITVDKVNEIIVNDSFVKKNYKIGEQFNPEDLVVIAEFADGVKQILEDQHIIEVEGGNIFKSIGEKLVTIRYGDVSTSIMVNVSGLGVPSGGITKYFVLAGGVLFILFVVAIIKQKIDSKRTYNGFYYK